MDIYVNSEEEALSKCLELKKDGTVNLFRGQARDWPTIVPSLFRLSREERHKAEIELDYFLEWADSIPQMRQYQGFKQGSIAVAQHYGIPTNLLDLTISPEIALIFSKRNDELIEEGSKSIIYCFSKSLLKKIDNGKLIEIKVDNLWRLETQEGVFLEFFDDSLISKLRDIAIRIHYPSVKIEEFEKELIYPSRKSHLETIIDQWFYLRNIEKSTEAFSNVPVQMRINRNRSYPGIYKWRQLPLLPVEWNKYNWITSSIESIRDVVTKNEINISFSEFDTAEEIITFISNLIKKPIQEYRKNKKSLLFIINIGKIEPKLNQITSKLVNRCWDGIRVLPYTPTEMINCIALTASLLIGRILNKKDINNWTKQLWGDIEYLEVAPRGGHISDGFVSTKDLKASFSKVFYPDLTEYFRIEIKKNPRYIMNWILEPWLIFDFSLFKKLYVEQFIPTSIDNDFESELEAIDNDVELLTNDMFSTSFNPTLLGYVTNSDYRSFSPISVEAKPQYIVYITPNMNKSDIEELFIYCLLHILNKGEPYQVRFSGYEFDKRGLWEISHIVNQCQWIIEISGISVLEVFIENGNDFMPNGFGAFDIWLIANNLVEKIKQMNESKIREYYEVFWKQLMFSNEDLEKRMNNWIKEKHHVWELHPRG